MLGNRALDRVLVACFALFAFTSLAMEPYVVFGLDLRRAGDPLAAGWLFYASRWDPAFLDPPLFLRVMCAIDCFVFGPFYLVLIYAFVKRREWIRAPALVFVGAVVYSTLVYFGWELSSERGRADLPMVVLVNVPYTVVPLVLAARLRRSPPFTTTAS
ncbi:MAG: emopamil-binding family protein [bacterium]